MIFKTTDRLLNKAWAKIGGYFWLPCRMCGEYFGGHEKWESCCITMEEVRHFVSTGKMTGVCPRCLPEAKQIQRRLFDKYKPQDGKI